MQTYNQTRHDHEITLEKQTVIELCNDDQEAAAIPQIIYHVNPPPLQSQPTSPPAFLYE